MPARGTLRAPDVTKVGRIDMALTDKELSELARQLDARQRTLASDVRDELGEPERREYGKLAGALPGDSGDQSVADEQADFSFVMTDRYADELQAIEQAKARMRDGTYGICIDCAGEIGFERLRAYPTAERCILDQERVEKTYVQGNKPTL
jgi:RNA polymerase-binding protein DksA